jgi:hypothetical protein
MFKRISAMILLAAVCWPALAVEQRHRVAVGEILKLDAATKTVVVKSADGTSHTFLFGEAVGMVGNGIEDGGSLHNGFLYAYSWIGSATLPVGWGLNAEESNGAPTTGVTSSLLRSAISRIAS